MRIPRPATALWLIAMTGLVLASCSGMPDRRQRDSTETAVIAPPAPDFINTVWEVAQSSAAEPGMLYAFLADSTLVMSSSQSNAAFGTWRYVGGALTLVEEGRSYPSDIVRLTSDTLRLVLRGPGVPVSMTLVRAGRPLPQ